MNSSSLNQLLALLVSLVCCGSPVLAAEPAAAEAAVDLSAELPRIQPLEPDEAMKVFEVLPGFQIQRMAAEPLVTSPVAMSFDENGRLFVVEMKDYSEQEHDALGQIRMLEDLDQDGVFDKATVVVEGLSWPTAILCYDGGVFVGAPPDLWYFKDTDGDGKADIKRRVFTGFGRTNVQGLMNCFRWGLDNRIHGATSSSGATVTMPDRPEFEPLVLRGRDFSFDPVKLDIRPESGGGQHGMYFDDWGRKFVCSNSNHAQYIAFDDRYLARNPFLRAPTPRIDIAIDGGQAPVFRSSPVEPWRIVRTRMRVSGQVTGAIEGGGRAAGYFTGATGIIIFRGDQLGPQMRGVAVVGDVGSNIVHRKIVEPKGVIFEARRIDEGTEFIRSSDIWFRPVQFDNSPDGCLMVLDMYREMIEHPGSIPPEIKKHLDTSSGQNRGRLYRIAPEHYVHRATPQCAEMSTGQLVELLSHENSWHRETAARLIYQRQDKSVVPQLRQLAGTGESPLGRQHALFALSGLGELDEHTVLTALQDEHPGVREHALRFAERFTASPEITEAVGKLVNDPDERVRYQLAFTAGEFPEQVCIPWLAAILKQDPQDRWIQLAVLSSLQNGATSLMQQLLADEKFRQSASASAVLAKLAEQVALRNSAADVEAVFAIVGEFSESETLLRNAMFCEMLSKGGAAVTGRVSQGPWKALLIKMLADSRQSLKAGASVQARIAAIDVLKFSEDRDDVELLVSLLTPAESTAIQSAALSALGDSKFSDLPLLLLHPWKELLPPVRLQAEEILFSRPQYISLVLDQLESGHLPVTLISTQRLQVLSKGKHEAFRTRAEKLLAGQDNSSRSKVVSEYRPVLELTGESDRGRVLFRTHCATCHLLEQTGFAVGPDLSAIRNRGKESILLNVLDPNREVNPEYLNYQVAMEDGRSLTGLIRSETATSLNLLRAGNQTDQILLNEIDQVQNSGLSLMPEGFEKQIDKQAMADLIAYLMTLDNAAK